MRLLTTVTHIGVPLMRDAKLPLHSLRPMSDDYYDFMKQKSVKALGLRIPKLSRGEYEGYDFPVIFVRLEQDSGRKLRDIIDMRRGGEDLFLSQIESWNCYLRTM